MKNSVLPAKDQEKSAAATAPAASAMGKATQMPFSPIVRESRKASGTTTINCRIKNTVKL